MQNETTGKYVGEHVADEINHMLREEVVKALIEAGVGMNEIAGPMIWLGIEIYIDKAGPREAHRVIQGFADELAKRLKNIS